MFKDDKYANLRELLLTEVQLRVLKDVREFLNVFHTIQQVVSADKTPTLSTVIPLYEQLIGFLETLKRQKPGISHMIQASIDKLKEYREKSKRSNSYTLAMCK